MKDHVYTQVMFRNISIELKNYLLFLRSSYYFNAMKTVSPELKFDHLKFFVLVCISFFISGMSINIIYKITWEALM